MIALRNFVLVSQLIMLRPMLSEGAASDSQIDEAMKVLMLRANLI